MNVEAGVVKYEKTYLLLLNFFLTKFAIVVYNKKCYV